MFKIDLHTHTIASGHAYSTLLENIRYGKEKGLEVIGVSDHAPTLPGSAYIFHFLNLGLIPDYVDGVRILKGVEANIIGQDGKIDMTSKELEKLDYAIASFHPPCFNPGTRKTNTKAMIGAMANPFVKIIGHPDDDRFPLDYLEIVKAAKEHDILLEVNNGSLSPNSVRHNSKKNTLEYLELCAKYNQKIVMGSDAHFATSIGDFTNCLTVIDEVNFPYKLIANKSVSDLLVHINA